MYRRYQMIKKILLIALPLFCIAISLCFSISAYLNYRENYRRVPVASHQLFQRTEINAEDLEFIDVPDAYLDDDVCTDEEEILGRYVKLGFSLAKGSLIYRGAIEENIRDLSLTLLKAGEANYDLYVGEVRINTGNLDVGICVDLYLTIKTNEKTISDLLIEHCRIIGLFDSQGRPIRSFDTDARVSIVSVAVRKEYVSLINKSLVNGTMSVLPSENCYDSDPLSRLNREAEVLEYLQ